MTSAPQQHIYTVTTDTAGLGCTSTDEVIITVMHTPALSFIGLPASVCSKAPPVQLNANPPGGTFVGQGVSSNMLNPQAVNPGYVRITYQYTDLQNCYQEITDSVLITAEPVITFLNLPYDACESEPSVNIDAAPSGGTFSGNGVSGNQFLPSMAGVGVHKIFYSYTDPNGCSSVDSVTAIVRALPTPSFTNLPAAQCESDAALEILCVPPGGSYTGSGVTGNFFDPQTAGIGAHTITYIYADSNGCSSEISSEVIVNPLPQIAASGYSPTCFGYENGRAEVTVTSGTPPFTYSWNGGNPPDAVIYSLIPGTYHVTVTDANGCSLSADAEVLPVPMFTAAIVPDSVQIYEGNSVELQAVHSSSGAVNYQWSPSSGLSCQCASPVASPLESSVYHLTVTDQSGCQAEASAEVIVIKPEIHIPNAFSPNGDGVNDEYFIYANGVRTMNLKIFNRWGELVFQSDDPGTKWDGSYHGKALQPDVFIYSVFITFGGGAVPLRQTGSITLIR